MKMTFLQLMLLSFCTLAFVSSSRILAILPFAFRSHQSFFQAILKTLAHRGHEVVVYSPIPLTTPVPNYTDVHLATSYSDDFLTYDLVEEGFHSSPIASSLKMFEFLSYFTEEALRHENIQKLVKSNEKFDVVITETFISQEPFLAFGHIFKAPTITLHPLRTYDILNYAMGNSLGLSYSPDFNFPFSDHMSFYERFINSYSTLKVLFTYHHTIIPKQQALLERTLKLQNAPSIKDMIKNISLVFVDHHPTINYARPYSPNMVNLGGIHLTTQQEPLPKNILKFMDQADHGVIYFSLGTVVPDKTLPNDFYRKFINVFKSLKQRVLWKTRSENIGDLPENVMVLKWAPQQDILAHPNCVLFLTHGGLLSQLEVINAGVPVVAIPFFGDQPLNVRFYQETGVGVKLDFLSLTEESISLALNSVLKNPEYKKNALKLSQISRDLPMKQTDSAVFWVEYVLRHGGAPHLQPASAHMAWYQLILLDVMAAILTAVLITLVVVYWTCRKVTSMLFRDRRKELLIKKLK